MQAPPLEVELFSQANRALRSELQKIPGSLRGGTLNVEGEGGEAALPVLDGDREGSRLAGVEALREHAPDFDAPEGLLGKDTGDNNKAQHHGQDQVEKVVAGVGGG
jgi:hypothetical protein